MTKSCMHDCIACVIFRLYTIHVSHTFCIARVNEVVHLNFYRPDGTSWDESPHPCIWDLVVHISAVML